MTTTMTASDVRNTNADELLREYHDARRHEDQWRIPQLLTALASPVLAIVALLFHLSGSTDLTTVTLGLTIIAGAAAALLAVEVWRWHRTALGIVNRFRTEYPGEHALLMKDPL